MQSYYSITDIHLSKLNFYRTYETPDAQQEKKPLEIKFAFDLLDDDNIALYGNVTCETSHFPFYLDIQVSAKIRFEEKLPDKNSLADIIEKESTSIVYTHLRNHIINITRDSNLEPLILPSLAEDESSRKEYLDTIKEKLDTKLQPQQDT